MPTQLQAAGCITEDGALYYRPATRNQKLYVFGHDRVSWIDWLGALFFVGVLGAVACMAGCVSMRR